MPITAEQKEAITSIFDSILAFTQGGRYKRHLHEIFLDLPDREEYKDYYNLIPKPRCLNDIRRKLEGDEAEDCLDIYHDLNLVFLNALYYNEEGSQVYADANRLKLLLDTEWKSRPILPVPRTSPPPDSPQKVNRKTSMPPPSLQTTAPQAPLPRTPIPDRPSTPASIPPQPSTVIASPTPLRMPQALSSFTTRSQSQAHFSAAVQNAGESLSTMRGFTPEPDVDVEEDHDPEDGTGVFEEARDGESEVIIRQLERGLPRWEGYGNGGWAEDIPQERFLEIVQVIKSYKDVIGTRFAEVLDAISEDAKIPDLPYAESLSLRLIESRARQNTFTSSREFDMEMCKLFLRARRYYDITTEPYGRVLLLQRLYQALTSSTPPSPPYISQTHFAFIRGGPGSAAAALESATSFRVSTKDRTFVDELHYKGQSIKLADWLHLANADDPSRPIVGQVFRCYVSTDPASSGKPGVTVCWYYRPEQTIHPAHRLFWDHEVFKTGQFADHLLPDVIEKIAVQFTARHIRGRPRPPYWYPGFPLYVCDSRYNPRERVFVKIKNWSSCVPEEVRKDDEWMNIYPFERTVYPRRFASPFLSVNANTTKAIGPGGLGEPLERAEGEKIEGGGTGRKRPKKSAGEKQSGTNATDMHGPSKGLIVGIPGQVLPQPTQHTVAQTQHAYTGAQGQAPTRNGEDRSMITAAGGWAALGTNVSSEKLPPETARHFDRDPGTNEVLWFAAPPMNVARTPAPRHSLAYLHFLATKRKRADRADEDKDEMVVEGNGEMGKRRAAPPRMTDRFNALYAEIFEQTS